MSEEKTNEALENEVYEIQRNKARLNLVYVSMFSIVMLFAGLTSAYIVALVFSLLFQLLRKRMHRD
mgnify:CR=1 FL=1